MSDDTGRRDDYAEIAKQFNKTVQQYCRIVESAPGLEKGQLLLQIYQLLPELIGQAIHLPDFALSDEDDPHRVETRGTHEQWKKLYELLKVKLGDADVYWEVWDPTKDNAAIHGTLADDIADIYGDLKKGVMLCEDPKGTAREAIWIWRVLFFSHWGKHAIDALRTMHFLLEESLS
jgi:hypothetical protein